MGPNVKKLLAWKVSRLAIPPGGGLADGLRLFLEKGRLEATSREGLAWVQQALAAVRQAPDNPYRTDEEIAGAILERIEK